MWSAPRTDSPPLASGGAAQPGPPAATRRRDESPSHRPHVLVVEDEPDLQDLLAYNLGRDGFRITCATTGEEALAKVRAAGPQLILLDLMLPGISGLEVCRALKADPAIAGIPVVMLTAKSEEADVVIGLELGADDYVTKPFSPRVLTARVKAVLRRRQREAAAPPGETAAGGTLTRGDITLDRDRHTVRVGSAPVELTATEFRLLDLLATRPGRVFTRSQIIEALHGPRAAVTDRSVDVQVVMLRRKLGGRGADIQTVRGVGYRFKE